MREERKVDLFHYRLGWRGEERKEKIKWEYS
jgi:hypothetical protein